MPIREPLAQRENLSDETLAGTKDLNIGMIDSFAGASTPPSNKRQGLHFDSVERNAQAVLNLLSQEVSSPL